MVITNYIEQIDAQLKILKEESNNACKNEVLFAFRGESRDYGDTKLTPSIFRNANLVKKEAYLFDLLCDYRISEVDDSNIEKAMKSQHYLAISRMLDISFNLLIALYFACRDHEKENGYVYIFAFPEYYSPHSKYIEEFYKNILEEDKNSRYYYKNFKVVSHAFSNDRMIAQNGGFIFFPGEPFCPINECYYKKVEIEAEHKKEILTSMKSLFAIDEYRIFPEKEKLVEAVKSKFNKSESFSRKISIREEIKSYFNHLYYEVELMKKRDTPERILRFLRKELYDLLTYIRNLDEDKIDENEKSMVIIDIINTFRAINMKVGNML